MGFSEEHKKHIADSVKKSWTPERRRQYSESRRGEKNPFFGKKHVRMLDVSGEKNPFFGRSHSLAAIEKLSKSRMGKSPKLYRYGITDDEYRTQTEAGNRWCFYHRGFVPQAQIKGRSICAVCKPTFDRERMLKQRFGVTVAWYDNKLAEQGGGCAICGSNLVWRGKNHLAIDHDHGTQGNRGILCARCNTTLAWIEKPGWLDAALAYLEKYKAA